MSDDTLETESAAPAPSTDPARRMPQLGRGTCIGRYVVLDRLGIGGMGVVYRAYDPDLDRRVALKLVREQSEDTTARMVREAQALAKVSHPNIVQVFDVGVFADTVFIAMELVEGRTLAQWARQERPAWRVVLAHLLDAARGLAAAHAAGLIHRDFKPSNAIVGGDGRVRVLDFGLARVASGGDTGDTGEDPPPVSPSSITSTLASRVTGPTALEVPERLSLDGETIEDDAAGLPRILASRVIGTPVYMAPEQRRRGVIDARADQFAFAVTAWELLHGQRPFAGDEPADYAAAAAAHRVEPPPAGTPVPAWVRRVLHRALSPAPGDRYRSIEELIAALEADPSRRRRQIGALVLGAAAIAGAAAAVAGAGERTRPCADAARHLAGIWDRGVADALEASLRGAGTSYAADTAAKVRAALDDRARAWIAMHTEACEATRVRGEQSAAMLDLRMGCLDRRREELRALVGALGPAQLEGAVAAVERLPDVAACADREALGAAIPPPTDPAARRAIDEERRALAEIRALVDTGQWAAGVDGAARAQLRARQLGWAPLEAEAAYLRGLAERNAGDLPAAEAALTEAAQAAARAHLDDLAADAWSELVAVVGYEAARPAEGLAIAGAAEAAILRADAAPEVRAGFLHARGQVRVSRGDLAAALADLEAALPLVADDPLERAHVLNTIAMVRSLRGDHAAAEQAHREVLATREAALGAGHPLIADSLDNLGVVVFHQGRHAEARGYYEQALALRVAAAGADHRDVGTSHNNLGALYLDAGDDARATEHLERALAIYERALGPDHADLAYPLSNLGELANRRGDHDDALDRCRRALALDETAAGPDDPDLAYALVCLGEAHLGRGDARAARDVLERALDLREKSGGDPGEIARTRFGLARALDRLGERKRARQLALAARDTFAALGASAQPHHAAVVTWLGNRR